MGIWILGLVFTLFILLALYIRLNDNRLTRIPEDALTFSPKRCSPNSVRTAAAHLSKSPVTPILQQLPPKTGRRYIIVGGGGFLGGWIVSQLLDRGEDPKHLRILDLRPPVRSDLKTGKAKDIQFIKTDVADSEAVEAAFAAPWPVMKNHGVPPPEITVFHTASNIRFYERHPSLLPSSERVNVAGTKNVIKSTRSIGASILIYTSSGSVAVRSSRFLLWPWQTEPKHFVQVINDNESAIPARHEDFFSNYAATKIQADRIVQKADKVSSGRGILRTGCIRPGNGIFGPRGDMLCGAYLVRQMNPTWISSIVQSFCYVENCASAHLCYEQRLAELSAGGRNPDIGGQAFVVADPGPTPTYGDVYTTLETLTDGECYFPNLSPTLMLMLAYIIEMYYLGRHFLIAAGYGLAKRLPAINGDLVNLQPSLFALTMVHLIFDDSRARLSPENGGLGYKGAYTTLEGLHKTFEEHNSGVGRSEQRSDLAGVSFGFGVMKAQRAVAKANEKVVVGLKVDPVKILSTQPGS